MGRFPAVLAERPRSIELAEIDELIPVFDLYALGVGAGELDADPLINPFHLGIMRLERAIGKDNALVDEVMVVGFLAKTAAERQNRVVRIAAVPKTLIFPLPNRSAQERWILVEQIVVLADRAHRVEHGMGVLAEIVRLRRLFILRDAFHRLRSRVHLAVQIGGVRAADAERLVMRRPVGIDRLDRLERSREILPAAALVAQRPNDD